MKTKISRIGKRSLSILLTMMLVVSMMVVGMVSVNAASKVTLYFASDTSDDVWFAQYDGTNHGNWYKLEKVTGATFNGKQVYKTSECYGDNLYLDLHYRTSGTENTVSSKTAIIKNSAFSNYDGKIYDDASATWSTYTTTSDWYLSGYIGYDGYSHSDTDVSSPEFKMTQSSSNSNIYTITYPVCGDQYFTVNDGTNVYHPTSDNAASGTAAGAPDTTACGSCWKWFAPAAGGSEITVTWNVSTKQLSWTVAEERTYTLCDGNDESLGTFTKASDGVYTLDVNLTAGTTTLFYIIDSEAVTYRRNSSSPITESGTTKTLYRYGTDDVTHFCSVSAPTTGKYTFTWEYTGDGASDTEGDITVDFPAGSTSYTITPSATTNGSISSNVASAEAGETVIITATPDAGFECTGVTVSPSTTVTDKGDGTYTFTMPASNVTVSATFAKVVESGAYTITKTASAFGTMTVVNASNVKEGTANEGDVITVTVNPLKGYACTGLTVATADVTANDDGTYTFTMPASNVTLTAEFEATTVTYNLSGSVSNAVITFSTSKSSSATVAEPGDKVTATITLNSGYICSSFAILDCNDVELSIEKLSSTKYTFIMPESDITATATVTAYTPDTNHTFRVYFKAPSAFAYQPKVSLDGAAQVSMTKGQELGKIYSGALTIYWFYYDFTVDTSKTHTLTFKTARTNLNATITDYFINDAYYLAVDNLMSGTEVVDLSQYSGNLEYVRNYYRSATHMVYPYAGASDTTDNTLGFTNINGVRYKMGECIKTGRVSITSATLIQKVSVSAETVDNVQMALLDVNLDGVVDVRDATLTQKYLVSA